MPPGTGSPRSQGPPRARGRGGRPRWCPCRCPGSPRFRARPSPGSGGGAQGVVSGAAARAGVLGSPLGPRAPGPSVPAEHLRLGLAEHGGCGRHHGRAGGCGAARPGRQPPQRQAVLGPQICKRPSRSAGPVRGACGAGWGGCVPGSLGEHPEPSSGHLLPHTSVCRVCHVCHACRVSCVSRALPTRAGAAWRGSAVAAALTLGPGLLGLGCAWGRPGRVSPALMVARPPSPLRGGRSGPPAPLGARWSLPCPEPCLAHSRSTKPICCPAAPRGRRTASRRCRRPGSTARW